MRLDQLSEDGILERIVPAMAGVAAADPRTRDALGSVLVGPGDDAAVLQLSSPRLVVTTDTLTEGQDFLPDATRPAWIGAKAAVQNLADVIAMGARPLALVVSLSAPGGAPAEAIEEIMTALSARAARSGAIVVGGDLGRAEALSLTVTALGVLPDGRAPVLRSGARPGDILAVSAGRLGRSAAGLALVLSGRRPGRCRDDREEELLAWHNAPDPDLRRGLIAAENGVHAMLDLSDGPVRDGLRIARSSGVDLDLDGTAFAADVAALSPVARRLLDEVEAASDGAPAGAAAGAPGGALHRAREWVLHGGEEHALLACFPAGALPEGFRAIGRVQEPEDGDAPQVLLDGDPVPGAPFDHFSG
ncbi:thiamine-phosphate kinase [Brachybacterium sp. EF45031]|uniref:thiamine-phosphate kinase n=1 Tax=Brachybacterium sillae TaxID=2810536 RepID=UPI00217E4AE1|nr:AIR synthase related protein [Brachybacterium sillae]MCS6710848.1 thiamine-phosphate kinase [Brachybacterium sillae]